MSRVAFPFLTLAPASIQAMPWEVARGTGDFAVAGDFLKDWDYTVDLRLRRTIRVVREAAAQDLALDKRDLVLAVNVQAGTGPGHLPRAIVRHVRCSLVDEATLELKIPGSVLSTVLHLQTSVVVADAPVSPGELSPRNAADRVWSDLFRLILEGNEPRFPIEVADLRTILGNRAAAHSPWYLHWSPVDWERDFHGVLRLYLNNSHSAFIEKVESEDPETLRYLMADVMGQVCEVLLRSDDPEDIIERCEVGTLGQQARHWLSLAFPEYDLARIRSVLEHQPGEFRSAMLAVADLPEGEV